MLQRSKRAFNIAPPTSPNAIMRRAETLPRRKQWTRQAHHGELDIRSPERRATTIARWWRHHPIGGGWLTTAHGAHDMRRAGPGAQPPLMRHAPSRPRTRRSMGVVASPGRSGSGAMDRTHGPTGMSVVGEERTYQRHGSDFRF